jgi:hypothetical protein
MAPEPRSRRAPKPSQKVRAVAVVTKPATKKAKKRTAKEASRVPKKKRIAPAPAGGVIDLTDDEATQAEVTQAPGTDDDLLPSEHEHEEPVLPQVFEYTALWRIEDKDKKERLEETTRDYPSSLLTTPLSEFKVWYEGLLLDHLSDYCYKKELKLSISDKGSWRCSIGK